MEKNLFGKTVKKKRTRIEILLAKQDRESLSVRGERMDYLRIIRNPFTHLKPNDYPYHLDIRIYRSKKMLPYKVLEDDAKEALSTMVTVLVIKVL